MSLIDEVKNNLDLWNIAGNQVDVPDGKLRIVKADLPMMTVKDIKKAIEGLSDDAVVFVSVDDYFYSGVATSIEVDENELCISRSDMDPRVSKFELVDEEEFIKAKDNANKKFVVCYTINKSKIIRRIMKNAEMVINEPLEFDLSKPVKIMVHSSRIYPTVDTISREGINSHLDDILMTIKSELEDPKYKLDGYKLEISQLKLESFKKGALRLKVFVTITESED